MALIHNMAGDIVMCMYRTEAERIMGSVNKGFLPGSIDKMSIFRKIIYLGRGLGYV